MIAENTRNTLKHYAHMHSVPIADDPTIQYIEKILKEFRPTHCLEIGSAIGYSTLRIAQKINTRGGDITSCEISYPSYAVAMHTIITTRLSNILLIHGNFHKFPQKNFVHGFDFVFIDGAKSEYLAYYLKLQGMLNKEYILIFDDVIKYSKKTQDLLDYLNTNKVSYSIHHLSDDDGVLVISHRN